MITAPTSSSKKPPAPILRKTLFVILEGVAVACLLLAVMATLFAARLAYKPWDVTPLWTLLQPQITSGLAPFADMETLNADYVRISLRSLKDSKALGTDVVPEIKDRQEILSEDNQLLQEAAIQRVLPVLRVEIGGIRAAVNSLSLTSGLRSGLRVKIQASTVVLHLDIADLLALKFNVKRVLLVEPKAEVWLPATKTEGLDKILKAAVPKVLSWLEERSNIAIQRGKLTLYPHKSFLNTPKPIADNSDILMSLNPANPPLLPELETWAEVLENGTIFMPSVDLVISRSPKSLLGSMRILASQGNKDLTLALEGKHNLESGLLSVKTRLKDVNLSGLQRFHPVFSALNGINIPFGGTFTAAFDQSLVFRGGDFTLQNMQLKQVPKQTAQMSLPPASNPAIQAQDSVQEKAEVYGPIIAPYFIHLPWLSDPKVPIQNVTIKGGVKTEDWINDQTSSLKLTVSDVSVQTPKGNFSAKGEITTVGKGQVFLNLNFGVQKLAAIDAFGFWPKGIKPVARSWIARSITGNIPSGQAKLEAVLGFGERSSFALQKLSGSYDFKDVSVKFLSTMPPVTDAFGKAFFDHRKMVFGVKGGKFADAKILGAFVPILGLNQKRQSMFIEAKAESSLPEALRILDLPPLGYTKGLGLSGKEVSGNVVTHLKISTPMNEYLSTKYMGIRAEARIQNASVKNFILGKDLTNSEMVLRLSDDKKISMQGTVQLAGIPATFDWKRDFNTYKTDGDMLNFSAIVDDSNRSELGFPWVNNLLRGNAAVEGRFSSKPNTNSVLNLDINLQQAEIMLDWVGYRKLPETAGQAQITIPLQSAAQRQATESPKSTFSMKSPKWSVAGDFNLNKAGLEQLALQATGGDKQKIALTFAARAHNNRLSVKANRLDWLALRPVIFPEKQTSTKSDSDGTKAANTSPQPSGLIAALTAPKTSESNPLQKQPPFRLEMNIAVLEGANSRELHDLKGNMVWRDSSLRSMYVTAITAGTMGTESSLTAGKLPRNLTRLTLLEDPIKSTLELTSGDLGRLLATMGFSDKLDGGQVRVSLVRDTPLLSKNMNPPFVGDITASGFKVSRAPILARLLNAISAVGFLQLLQAEGLEFDRFSTGVQFHNGEIVLKDGATSGSSIGLTFGGKLNIDTRAIDLRGTVVPAIGINRMIGVIPVLGKVITGGDGQGILAATYSMRGSLEDPRVRVNPLSVLTPGILRTIFFQRDEVLDTIGDLETGSPLPITPSGVTP